MAMTRRLLSRNTLLCILIVAQQQCVYSFQPHLKAATSRRYPLRTKNQNGSYQLNSDRHNERPLGSSSVPKYWPLFPAPQSRKRGALCGYFRRIPFIISSIVVLASIPSRASDASIRQSLPSIRSAVPWKRVTQALLSIILVSASISNMRVKRRQAADATSEWARYAQRPSARGRAILWLVTQQALFVLFSKIVWFRQKQIREYAGRQFAEGLLKLGPLYIKLGQIFSSRKNLLGPEWIEAMGILQDKVPARTGNEAMQLAYATLEGGKAEFERIFSDFESTPLAAASLGQVHRAKLRTTGDVVAVKVQRPYLRQIYDQDLEFLSKIARTFDRIPGSRKNVGGVSSSWTKIIEDAEKILYREIDYREEAKNGVRFSEDFGLTLGGKSAPISGIKSKDGEDLPSAADWIRAPYVFDDVSNEKLLVMEFVPSIKVTDTKKLDSAGVTAMDKIDLADALARAYLRQLCCNRFFSTDPHAGNLGVEIRENGKPRLVMYDFGQAASLSQDQSDGILEIIEAIIDMDVGRSIKAFIQMGVLVDDADLDKVRSKVAENYRTGKVKANRKKMVGRGYQFRNETTSQPSPGAGINGTDVESKDSEVMSFFTLPAEYAFVARALSQMDGVGKTLDPDFDFISNSAPYIVEIKGANKYLKDEVAKWFQKFIGTGEGGANLDIQDRITDIQMRQIPEWWERKLSKKGLET